MLLASGALGLRLGAVAFPDWQVAVEPAQVIAGIVSYPAATPFSVYQTKLWSLLHELSAVALVAGVPEPSLSLAISGLLGMLTLQALAMVVYALSGDAVLAVGSSFLIFFTRAAEHGVVYPIYLLGTSHTYGVVGLSTAVLAAGLIGAGWHRSGALLVGLAPALHPSLGVWLGLIAFLAAVSDRRLLVDELSGAWPYFAGGCVVTVAAYGVHAALAPPLPPVDAPAAERYLDAFIRFWDGHRRPAGLDSNGGMVTFGAIGLAAFWHTACRARVTRAARFLLRFIVAAGLVGILGALFSQMPVESQPALLTILMPARVLNLAILMAPALLLGLVGALGGLVSRLLALGLAGGLLVSNRSMLWDAAAGTPWLAVILPDHPTRPLQVMLIATVLLVTAAAWRRFRRASPLPHQPPAPAHRRAEAVLRAALVLVVAALVVHTVRIARPRLPLFDDWRTDPVFERASRGRGLLVTGGNMQLIQLRTRRPVLLDGGGLDALPYTLEVAAETAAILRDVYAIDLFDPPEEARGIGAIPNGATAQAWAAFPRARWQAIGRRYQATQVLTYVQWNLDLPVVARNAFYILYQIPE